MCRHTYTITYHTYHKGKDGRFYWKGIKNIYIDRREY